MLERTINNLVQLMGLFFDMNMLLCHVGLVVEFKNLNYDEI